MNAPHGRTELERLADIDAPPRVSGDDIFVVGFQGRVAMLALDSGQIWWARDASSYRGFTMDDDNLYLTNADSVVIAMKRSDGAVLWEQDAHEASRPDRAGDRRRRARRRRLRGLPALARQGDRRDRRAAEDGRRAHHQCPRSTTDAGVFVQTDSGKLLAFKSQPKPAPSPMRLPTAEQPKPGSRAHRRRMRSPRSLPDLQPEAQPTWLIACCPSSRSSGGRMSASRRSSTC